MSFNFAMMVAERSRNAANGLGLRYADLTAKLGTTYRYRVSLVGAAAPYTVEPALVDVEPTPRKRPENVQVVEADAPTVELLAVRPSWVRVQSADGTVLFEKILDAGERYVVPQMEAPALLRAGNSGSVYFAVNGQTYGPAAAGAQVVKNVALSPEALTASYQLADLSVDPDLAAIVAVAEATPQAMPVPVAD